MGRTAADLTPEQREQYYRHALERRAARQEALVLRRQMAWALAHQCSHILKKRFGAHRVVVYGSLLDAQRFGERSDVDMAAWGIAPQETFTAMGELWATGIAHGIEINLADPAMCHSELLESILREGMDM